MEAYEKPNISESISQQSISVQWWLTPGNVKSRLMRGEASSKG